MSPLPGLQAVGHPDLWRRDRPSGVFPSLLALTAQYTARPQAQEKEAWGRGAAKGPRRRQGSPSRAVSSARFLFCLCHYRRTTRRRSSTFPQPFQKGERVDGAAVGGPSLLFHFPRSLPQLPRSLPSYSGRNFQVPGSWMSLVHTARP